MATVTRYDIRSLQRVIAELTGWSEQTESSISTEESRANPNDERLDSLQTRLDALTAAVEALADIE